jgi:hypothetical protein
MTSNFNGQQLYANISQQQAQTIILEKVKCKKDAYKMWSQVGKRISTRHFNLSLGEHYIPPIMTTNKKYFRDLICGAKKALTNAQAKRIEVTKYAELNSNFALE